MAFDRKIGSRAEVFHGRAEKTTGGLRRKDLMKNKRGEIVSVKKHRTAKREKRLEKHGYFAEKGKFGYVKKTPKRSKTAKKGKKGRNSRRKK